MLRDYSIPVASTSRHPDGPAPRALHNRAHQRERDTVVSRVPKPARKTLNPVSVPDDLKQRLAGVDTGDRRTMEDVKGGDESWEVIQDPKGRRDPTNARRSRNKPLPAPPHDDIDPENDEDYYDGSSSISSQSASRSSWDDSWRLSFSSSTTSSSSSSSTPPSLSRSDSRRGSLASDGDADSSFQCRWSRDHDAAPRLPALRPVSGFEVEVPEVVTPKMEENALGLVNVVGGEATNPTGENWEETKTSPRRFGGKRMSQLRDMDSDVGGEEGWGLEDVGEIPDEDENGEMVDDDDLDEAGVVQMVRSLRLDCSGVRRHCESQRPYSDPNP